MYFVKIHKVIVRWTLCAIISIQSSARFLTLIHISLFKLDKYRYMLEKGGVFEHKMHITVCRPSKKFSKRQSAIGQDDGRWRYPAIVQKAEIKRGSYSIWFIHFAQQLKQRSLYIVPGCAFIRLKRLRCQV